MIASARTPAVWANAVGRLWLVAAAASLALPVQDRLGVWLPVHMALAGAATTTISGNMQMFAATLTATRAPGAAISFWQLGLVVAGAAMVAVGHPAGHPPLADVGALCSGVGIALLAIIVRDAWSHALNRRHALPLILYAVALACALIGGAVGSSLGGDRVHDPMLYLALRRTHVTLNLLGFVSLTIAATMLTLLPTVLRVRAVLRGAVAAAWALGLGVGTLALGFAFEARPLAAAGALGFAAGALLIAWAALAAIRAMLARKGAHPPLAAAGHLLLSLSWFCGGAVALAAVLVSNGGVDAFLPVALVVFVLGWTVQVLLGAWSYLIPSAAPGGPEKRRAYLAAMDVGAAAQVVIYNAGLAGMALHAASLGPAASGRWGAWLALLAGAAAVARTWLFRLAGNAEWASRRGARMFGA
jgi:nitrite reductase (NO-forming)